MSRPEESWKNRIVGYGEEDPEQLLASPQNWRIHPRAQQDALSSILADVGVVQAVIVNRRNQTLIDGHLRVSLALRSHQKSVPVVYVDLSEAEERLILACLDPITSMAIADKDKLDDLLRQVQTDDAAVQAMLAEVARGAGLDYGAVPPEDPGPQLDRAEELREKWGVHTGDLFGIGRFTHCPKCGKVHDLP